MILIEAAWSRSQKDIMKSKLSITNAEARVMSKLMLIALCKENGDKHRYQALFSFQTEVKHYDRMKKLSEQDQLFSIGRSL